MEQYNSHILIGLKLYDRYKKSIKDANYYNNKEEEKKDGRNNKTNLVFQPDAILLYD